jgi:hypothetical protein
VGLCGEEEENSGNGKRSTPQVKVSHDSRFELHLRKLRTYMQKADSGRFEVELEILNIPAAILLHSIFEQRCKCCSLSPAGCGTCMSLEADFDATPMKVLVPGYLVYLWIYHRECVTVSL